MLDALNEVVATSAVTRATLLLNHMLSSEPVASGRLRPHAGRCLRVRLIDWPGLLPVLPTLRFVLTPAGLLEWQPASASGPDAEVDLDITLNAGNPANLLLRGLMGQRPAVSVAGDATLAADVSWVIDNLRWDVRDDLARIFGELPARELARSASAMAAGLRSAIEKLVRQASAPRGGSSADGAPGSSPAQRPAR